jgi:hypothetical protein
VYERGPIVGHKKDLGYLSADIIQTEMCGRSTCVRKSLTNCERGEGSWLFIS